MLAVGIVSDASYIEVVWPRSVISYVSIPLGSATIGIVNTAEPSLTNDATQGLRLVAYLRVSSNEQAERGTIEQQRRAITRWAKGHGHKIARFCYDEAVSGKLDAMARPGLTCVVDGLQGGKLDGVVMTKLDRLARELTVQEATLALFWRADARVFTLDAGEVLADDPSDPMRTAMRQMMGVFAQLERGMIRARLEAGKAHKAEQGGYVGGAPRFGTRAERRHLVEVPEEAETVARIVELREAGCSYRQIVAVLNEEGRTTKHGHPWIAPTVRRTYEATKTA